MSTRRSVAIAAAFSLALHAMVLLLWGWIQARTPPAAPATQWVPQEVEVMRLQGIVSRRPAAPSAREEPPGRPKNGRATETRRVVKALNSGAVAVSDVNPLSEQTGEAAQHENVVIAGENPEGASDPSLDTSELSRRLQEAALRCYPSAARRFRQQGEAQVRFCLGPAGALLETGIASSSGSTVLDHAASSCVVPGAAPFGPEAFGRCFTVPVRFAR